MAVLTKAELIDKISQQTGISRSKISLILQSMTDNVMEAVANGDQVIMRGFGCFLPKFRALKKARNITRGTSVIIPEHNVPAFKPYKSFINKVK